MGRGVDEGRSGLWRERLARYGRSGQTVVSFCAAEGVSVPSFYQWKRRLAVSPATRRAKRAEGRMPSAEQRVFVPLHITGSAQVEIELPNGARVRVPANDMSAIAAAITAAGRLATPLSPEPSPC